MKENNSTIIFGHRVVVEALASKNNIEKVFLLKDSKKPKFKMLKQQLREHHIAISYVPKEYREYISVNYGRPDKSKTYINDVFNYSTNTAVEVTFSYMNMMPNSDAFSVSAVTLISCGISNTIL